MRQCRRPISQVLVFMAKQDTSKASGAVGIAHHILSVGRAEIMSGTVAQKATGRGKAREGECRKRSSPLWGEVVRGISRANCLTCLCFVQQSAPLPRA